MIMMSRRQRWLFLRWSKRLAEAIVLHEFLNFADSYAMAVKNGANVAGEHMVNSGVDFV